MVEFIEYLWKEERRIKDAIWKAGLVWIAFESLFCVSDYYQIVPISIFMTTTEATYYNMKKMNIYTIRWKVQDRR